MRNFFCFILVIAQILVGAVESKSQENWPSTQLNAIDELGDPVSIEINSQIPDLMAGYGELPLQITIKNQTTSAVAYDIKVGIGARSMTGQQFATRIEVAPKSSYQGITLVPYHQSSPYAIGSITVRGSHFKDTEYRQLNLEYRRNVGGRITTVREEKKDKSSDYVSLKQMKTFPSHPHWLRNASQLEISEEQWRTMASDSKNGILDWVFQGGDLLIVSSQPKNTPTEKVGLGRIIHAPGDSRVNWTNGSDMSSRNDAWLGHQRKTMLDQTQSGSWVLWLVFAGLLPTYAVLAGPWVLTKYANETRRHRIFVILPFLAILTTGVLAVIILLQDGTGGVGSRTAIYVLNPESKKGHLLQYQDAKTGLLLGSSFVLPLDIILCKDEESTGREEREKNTSVLLEPAKGTATYSGSWFQSRNVQRQVLSRTQENRGTYQISDNMELTSSSSESLKNVFVFKDWQIYKAAILRPGQKVSLQKATKDEFQAFHRRLGLSHLISEEKFPDGALLAELEDPSQILEPTLKSIEWKNDQALLFTVCTP